MAQIKLNNTSILTKESREEIIKQINQKEGWIHVTEAGVEGWIKEQRMTINIDHIVMIIE